MSTEMEKVPTTVTVDKEETTWEREKQSPMHPKNEAKNQGETKNYPLQYILLFLLVFQNSSVILATRYSRVVRGDLYFTTTAVFLTEMLKLFICSSVMFYQTGSAAGVEIIEIFTVTYVDTLKMSVPAIMYVFQNNLLYIAASNLDAAVFQVLSQLKLLTTALFSVIILRRELNWLKWLSLFILFVGISLVQYDNFQQTYSISGVDYATHKPIIGFLAVLGATSLSGFVGVYVEKQLKGVTASLWVKNIQLSFFGGIVSSLYIAFKDGYIIFDKGFFFGYTPIVCAVIIIQAAGGILVAAVIKYADNIVKGFATSIALIVSFIASIFIFSFTPSHYFICGLVCVGIATYMYSKPS